MSNHFTNVGSWSLGLWILLAALGGLAAIGAPIPYPLWNVELKEHNVELDKYKVIQAGMIRELNRNQAEQGVGIYGLRQESIQQRQLDLEINKEKLPYEYYMKQKQRLDRDADRAQQLLRRYEQRSIDLGGPPGMFIGTY